MAKVIFRCISDCLYGTGEWDPSKAVPAAPAVPEVTLDSTAMGTYILASTIVVDF